MKILFLGEPSSPNTMSWVEGLREQGCEVILASARTDGTDWNIPIGNPKLTPRLRVLTGVSNLKKIIADVKPDILLAYRITSYGYLAAKTGFHPLVLAAQNEQIVYLPKPSFFRRKFLERCVRYAVKNADLMHAWGDNIAQGLMKFGADESKILTLHRGIDMESFQGREEGKEISNIESISNVKGEKGGNKDTGKGCLTSNELKSQNHKITKSPIFLSTRSLYPEYLIDKVLDAFSLLLKKIPDARLEIAGSGLEEPLLKSKVKQLGIVENVKFYGRLDPEPLIDLLKSSDIYLSIIETEGLSSSLIESIVCELLPIVSDMPGSRGMVHDKVDGYLVKSVAPEDLCLVMLEAVENYEKLKPALIKNSKAVKEKFSREINQKIFIEKYRELL